MKERCWNCGRGDAEILPGDDFVSCKCGTTGPSPDQDGRLWDVLGLLARFGGLPTSSTAPIRATLETAEHGSLPWRLEIATRFALDSERACPDGFDVEGMRRNTAYCLRRADALIAAHNAMEKGGAA